MESRRWWYVLSTVCNFCGLLFGSGWVTMPITATQMGLLLSSLSILGLGLVNGFACTVMLQAAEEFGTPESYHDLTQKVLGNRWALLLDAAIVLSEFFACCQRLILVGDFAVSIKHRLITHRFMPNRPLIVLLLAVVLTWPLIYVRNLKKLEKVSFGAIICTLTGLVILAYTLVDTAAGEGLPTNEIVYANWSPNLLLGLPIQEFAFAGQTGVIPIYKEMQDRSLARGKAMVLISFVICSLLYVTFGILGYLQYPGTLEANFFNVYETKPGALYTALYFIALVSVVGAFPLNVIIGRLHMGYLVLGPKRAEERGWAALFATILFLGSVGVAVAIKNLGVVQGLGGGIAESFINLVVPGFALLKLIDRQGVRGDSHAQRFDNPAFEEGGKDGEADSESSMGGFSQGKPGRQDGEGAADESRSLPNRSDSSTEASGDTHAENRGQQGVDKSGGKRDRSKRAPAGQGRPSEPKSRKHFWLNKFAAFGLFTVAALQAGIATAGYIVSLCLVGWDNASLTFYSS